MTEISRDIHVVPSQRPPFWLEDSEVDAFIAGGMDSAAEERLARAVAPLVPAHRSLPNHTVGTLSRLARHLGGSTGVLSWLDRFPGEPRAVSRVVAVGDVLEALSDDPTVVAALAQVRAGDPYPAGLRGHLIEATDETVLSSLAHDMEHLAAQGRTGDAVELAVAAATLLGRVLSVATANDPSLVQVSRALPGLLAALEEIRG